ncbi:hypothetical protein SAMN04487769_3253 [Burkholderia sp. b14]|nr:hypothetical protein SAMN04487768_1393 [Burkholderia sp. b13]SIT80594.1 hypothetical protein SAMN04487769_3253 [Burkholderia sp. b14]
MYFKWCGIETISQMTHLFPGKAECKDEVAMRTFRILQQYIDDCAMMGGAPQSLV